MFVRGCAISSVEDPVLPNLFAISLGDAEYTELTLCLIVFANETSHNASDTTNGTYTLLVSYSPRAFGMPCTTDPAHLPDGLTIHDFVRSLVARADCPLTSVIPPLLIQPLVNTTTQVLTDVTVHVTLGFEEGGWIQRYVGGALEAKLCANSVTSLDPSLSGLFWADQLWGVVFGDAATGIGAACGWFARSGTNLTYDILRGGGSPCPTTLVSSRAKTLEGYWQPFNLSATSSLSLSSTPTPTQVCAFYAAARTGRGAAVCVAWVHCPLLSSAEP